VRARAQSYRSYWFNKIAKLPEYIVLFFIVSFLVLSEDASLREFTMKIWSQSTSNKNKHPAYIYFIALIFNVMFLASCGGGGGGGGGNGGGTFSLDGGAVSGTFSPTSSKPAIYSFDVVAGTPYSISLVNTTGDTALYVYTANPLQNPDTLPIGISWTDGIYENVSFIANISGTIYALPIGFSADGSATSYTIAASTNHISVNAQAKTAATYSSGGIFGSNLFYSFDAVAGMTYEVRVSPDSGDVNLGRVTLNSDMSGSIGSSSNTGTLTDAVFFTSTVTDRYYVRVDGMNIDSTFSIAVYEVPSGPDLSVMIDSAISDGDNVIVDFTVTNTGADAYSGDVQVDLWSDSNSAPGVGMTGESFVTLSAVSLPALGGSTSASVSFANTAEGGAAYLVVDTINAIAEGNENNNVSTAGNWLKPYLAPLSLDFEDGIIPIKTTMSGNAGWVIDLTNGGNGSSTSLHSENIGNSQKACFSISAYNADASNISFDRSVSSESYWDKLKFYIDDIEQNVWSGIVAWDNVTFSSSPGLHEYKWCYIKDFITSSGTDEAWVDNISITSVPPTLPDLSVVVDSASWDGNDVVLNYTVYNNSGVDSGSYRIDFWSATSVAPLLGDSGESTVNNASINLWSSYSGTVSIPNADASTGLAYAIVDTTNVLAEANETNNVSSGRTLSNTLTDLSIEITGVWSGGSDVRIDYLVTNNGSYTSLPFNVDLFSNEVTVPLVGSLADAVVSHGSLAVGGTVAGSVVIADTSLSGVAYAIVDNSDVVVETDEQNNVSAGIAWEILPSAPLFYDFQDNVLPTTLTMSGDANWLVDNNGVGNGQTRGLQSGAITHSQQSCTTISLYSSSSIAFDYNVSSESGWDYLKFYIDGVQQNAWSGTVDWTNASYVVTTGAHDYKWCYTKDGSVTSGSDAAWIDNITIN